MTGRHHAFTLLELAVVLVIVSLMTGFGLQVFQTAGGQDCYAQTEAQLKAINSAIETFTSKHSRLPKPAYPTLGSNDPAFGMEASDGADGDTLPDDNTVAAYGTMIPAGMSNAAGVLIGALPHSDLGLSVDYAADCWGNKFTYAVTNVLTGKDGTAGYPGSLVTGAITLNGNSIASPNLMSDKIDYVVISHGMNKFGATPMSANNRAAGNCNGTAGSMIDKENCDTLNTVFYNSVRNIGTGAVDYFDDIVIFGKKSVSTSSSGAQLYCWGRNNFGQLGNGNTGTDRNAPVLVTLPTGVTSFTAVESARRGSSSCTVANDQRAYCWGYGGLGNLGNGGTSSSNIPAPVTLPGGVTSFAAVSSGYFTSCGIGNNGRAYCWGGGASGKLGNGTTGTDSSVPVPVTLPSGVTAFTAISITDGHACGIGNNGMAYCWGDNPFGQLGNGNTGTDSNVPVPVTLPSGVTAFSAISAGAAHTCGIGNDGRAYCWGINVYGELGNGTTGVNSNVPVPVTLPGGVTSFTAISSGVNFNYAIGNNGRAYFWGGEDNYQSGSYAGNSNVPVAVPLPSGVTSFSAVSAGLYHGCALGNNNRAYCWGDNTRGQIGDSTNTTRGDPTAVTLPFGVSSFSTVSAVGDAGSCALSFNAATDCAPQTVTWGSCSTTIGNTVNGQALLVNSRTNGYAGSATATCNAGVVTLSGTTCTAVGSCADTLLSWGTGCSAMSGVRANGDAPSISNTAVGRTGSVTATCTGSSFVQTSPVCNLNCSGGTETWGACAGPAGAATHGAPGVVVANTNSGQVGNVTVTCNNGSFTQSGATCAPVPPSNCGAQAVSWGSGCSATAPGLNHGDNTGVTNVAAGRVGTATASCNNGTTTASGTCNLNCSGRAESWAGSCSGTTPAINHGDTSVVPNTAPGYTGNMTMSCTNGTLSQTSIFDCDPVAPTQCPAQSFTWGAGCNGSAPVSAPGAVVNIVGNAPQGGNLRVTCQMDYSWSQSLQDCLACYANGNADGGSSGNCCSGYSSGGICAGAPGGTVVGSCTYDLVCMGGGAYSEQGSCVCDYSSCASGSGNMVFASEDLSACPTPEPCTGFTFPTASCDRTRDCICN